MHTAYFASAGGYCDGFRAQRLYFQYSPSSKGVAVALATAKKHVQDKLICSNGKLIEKPALLADDSCRLSGPTGQSHFHPPEPSHASL